MGASNKPSDPNKLAVPFKPKAGQAPDLNHHTQEWTSGTRGGGSVPADFGWQSNPKQRQEELGSGDADASRVD